MKRACFIIPYFGKLPNYFQLFLNSCAPNKKFDWLIITNDNREFSYPKNVKKIFMEWNDFKRFAQKKFKEKLALEYPKKLCDFKPTYGYLFEDLIRQYSYWGYCDIDTIMGNLDEQLPLSFLNKYDKIFSLGHMVLFKNSFEINRAFLKPVNKEYYYKKALTSDKIEVFDETGNGKKNIDTIFVKNGYNVFHADWSYNPRVTPTKFKNVIYDYYTDDFYTENYKKSICIWDGHNIVRYVINNNNLKKESFLYVHLQQRKMKLGSNVLKAKAFSIIPNEFNLLDLPVDVSKNYIKKLKRKDLNLHYFRIMWKWKIAHKLKNAR